MHSKKSKKLSETPKAMKIFESKKNSQRSARNPLVRNMTATTLNSELRTNAKPLKSS